MTQRAVTEVETGGKVALFFSSVLVGVVCGVVLRRWFGLPLALCVRWGVLSGVLNPLAARLAVCVSQCLHCLAFPDTYERWSVEMKVWMGAFWPVTLPFWVVVFIFFVSINRIFR